jgi:hypothetical protein
LRRRQFAASDDKRHRIDVIGHLEHALLESMIVFSMPPIRLLATPGFVVFRVWA